jgi:hypothetical protein
LSVPPENSIQSCEPERLWHDFALQSIAVEEKLFKSAEETKFPPTAFVYDAQRQFGWR